MSVSCNLYISDLQLLGKPCLVSSTMLRSKVFFSAIVTKSRDILDVVQNMTMGRERSRIHEPWTRNDVERKLEFARGWQLAAALEIRLMRAWYVSSTTKRQCVNWNPEDHETCLRKYIINPKLVLMNELR